MNADETAYRNGWTPETLAAYQAERDAALEANVEMRTKPGVSPRSIRATLGGTFPRLRFSAVVPAVDDGYSYLRGHR